MKKLFKNLVITSFLFMIPLYIIFSVPKYPIINSSLSKEDISKNIEIVIKENTSKFSLENLYDKEKLLEYGTGIRKLANNLDNCESKECLIKEYDYFMNNWVSIEIKTSVRYVAISDKYGFIGDIINENFDWLYHLL
ncbi:hypothetical protein [Arcobacter cloacae]|uniref:Uncharacterized protein n=1 Tax=Arcobacter cloacae TaxID=1054034 RepID=A0A6M8NIQ9_9BACT|nr:hypothetical protein [Arcobacter cloacae]QKF89220.1 hypothetical protein ACLO_0703 [Arcobacter cloacae]RXI42575.1 hypothetical protein CP963_03515 [Arcobacter cloacae]